MMTETPVREVKRMKDCIAVMACSCSVIVQLKVHAIVNLIIAQHDVVLVDRVPLLNTDLRGLRARLRRHQLLQLRHRSCGTAHHTQDTHPISTEDILMRLILFIYLFIGQTLFYFIFLYFSFK